MCVSFNTVGEIGLRGVTPILTFPRQGGRDSEEGRICGKKWRTNGNRWGVGENGCDMAENGWRGKVTEFRDAWARKGWMRARVCGRGERRGGRVTLA